MSETTPKDDRIVVEAWMLFEGLAVELAKVAGDVDATQELAQHVKGIAEALREHGASLPSSTEKEG
ncbi:hypothetical protein DLM45_02510 [Hyphomicrobium methylovorum]|uniref:hypothetical protein n=1 Tax=Hyphomicrobium methylovorum TaxID=84 RepID=UPI0015E65587|nr:hypothetical protein [Hyphomicrobium methylovorum]MBA2125098.1 hypothetical protein [Hyphomicrobium methylovorum]